MKFIKICLLILWSALQYPVQYSHAANFCIDAFNKDISTKFLVNKIIYLNEIESCLNDSVFINHFNEYIMRPELYVRNATTSSDFFHFEKVVDNNPFHIGMLNQSSAIQVSFNFKQSYALYKIFSRVVSQHDKSKAIDSFLVYLSSLLNKLSTEGRQDFILSQNVLTSIYAYIFTLLDHYCVINASSFYESIQLLSVRTSSLNILSDFNNAINLESIGSKMRNYEEMNFAFATTRIICDVCSNQSIQLNTNKILDIFGILAKPLP